MMPSFISLPSICLSLLLCINPAEGINSRHYGRSHKFWSRAPRDFGEHKRQDGIVAAGSGLASGFVGTSGTLAASTLSNNYTFTAIPTRSGETVVETLAGSSTGTAADLTVTVSGSAAATLLAAPVGTIVGFPEGTITVTSQGMPVTSIVPVYTVCELPGGSTTACSTVQQTVVTSICSTVLTGFFTRVTISECDQSITFSTQNSYNLLTTTAPPAASATGLQARQAETTTAYIQSVVSYYIAPWQSIVANNQQGITVLVCTIDNGVQSCQRVQEVWVIHTELVPIVVTSTVIVSQNFQAPAVVVFGDGQSTSVTAGTYSFSAVLTYSALVLNSTTSTQAAIDTVQVTAVPGINVNAAVSANVAIGISSEEPELTTTILSTTKVTKTITVQYAPTQTVAGNVASPISLNGTLSSTSISS